MSTVIVFLVVFLVLLLVIVGMSIGVLMGRKPISGSCGGMGAIGMAGACDICGGDYSKCEEKDDTLKSGVSALEVDHSLASDAMDSVKKQ